MTKTNKINLELSLSEPARRAADKARVLHLHRHLLLAYPPAAGPLNRVVQCVGTELRDPDGRGSLLVSVWAASGQRLREVERSIGMNNPAYLVVALKCVTAPLDAALGLRVTAAPDSVLWIPEEAPSWNGWRAAHPGTLDVVSDEPPDRDERRLRVERWALGPRFLYDIKATSQWPDAVTVE